MYLCITKTGTCHPNHHMMKVDTDSTLIDLDCVAGTLLDPTVTKVEWGDVWVNLPNRRDSEKRERGILTMQDGTQRIFTERSLLEPYLAAFRKQLADAAQAQTDYDAAHPAIRPEQSMQPQVTAPSGAPTFVMPRRRL